MLYLETLCPRKFNGGNQNFETDVVFSLVFGKNSKMHARGMVFWKRTMIMANKNDHKSCVLTQICIAYNLILTCRWFVKRDVNVFSNIKTNVAIYGTRQILYTHVANNWHVQLYPFIPRHFEVFTKNKKKTSVLNSWQNAMY